MRDQIANLTNLDLSNANIAAFEGIALSSVSYSYPANEMLRLSFYNGSAGKAKTTLVSIILPNSLTSIGEYAFRLCGNIKPVYIIKENGGSNKYDGILEWKKDPEGIVERLFFEHHYPCSSFVTISKNGDYISYFGEFGKEYVWEATQIMNK